MNITRAAIEKNRITIVVIIIVVLSGLTSYYKMSRAEDPGFVIRTALVTTYWRGASPERVEQLVTDKLEKAIQEIPEIDFISSTSKTGISVIFVNIKESYTDMRPIWDSLRRKVDKARVELPENIQGPFVNDEFGDVFGIVTTITGDGYQYSDLKDVADEVRDELLLLGDVAKVEIFGSQDQRIFVEYNNARLSEIGLSPSQLKEILSSRNIIVPGGDIDTEYEKIVLEPSGNFFTLDEVKTAIIEVPGKGEVVYLQDIANIYRGYIDPPEDLMRCTGEPCLGLAISMREGGNIIELGDRVEEVMEVAQSYYPIGVEFGYVQFQPRQVQKKVNEFTSNLIQAISVVALVMLLTLGVRTGLIVASLIPTAVLSALMLMGILQIGLDQISLAALIIALGMLVDNGIVMSESIMVQIAAGKKPFFAAIDSATELRAPLLTSSLTTAAAFLPIYLAESAVGEYTASLFKVVSITLLSSWVLSITMIPYLCCKFLKIKHDPEAKDYNNRYYRTYKKHLVSLLKHPYLTLAVVGCVFLVAMYSFKFIPNIFFPPNDRPSFTVELNLPIGTPIKRTEEVTIGVENYIMENFLVDGSRKEGVTDWASFIGQGAPRFILSYSPEPPSPDYGILVVNTTSRKVIDEIIPEIERFCLDTYPDLKPVVRPLELGPPSWPPVEVRISGRDTDKLFEIVEQVKEKMANVPGTKLIDDDWGPKSKKLLVTIDQARALRAGVTSQDIAISLQTYLSGLFTTEFREEDKLIPVTMRSVGSGRDDIGKLEGLNVFVQSSGQSLPLKQVADIEVAWQPAKIVRRNRLRTVTVESALQSGYTAAEINAELTPWLEQEQKDWGLGYYWEFGGETEASEKGNTSINEKLPIAMLIILLLMVWQFNSIRRPIIIFITMPLGLIGVVVGLWVTDLYFGFMTLLGIISLAGIVINNAIVLLDRINIEINENGLDPPRAVIESAQRRLRPIVLTTVTTALGLVPLWLGGGPIWEPMSVAIIFGLLFATILTLGVVPVLYSLLFGVSYKDINP